MTQKTIDKFLYTNFDTFMRLCTHYNWPDSCTEIFVSNSGKIYYVVNVKLVEAWISNNK